MGHSVLVECAGVSSSCLFENTGWKTSDVGAFVWADPVVEQVFWIHWSKHCEGRLLEESPPHQSAIPEEKPTVVTPSASNGVFILATVFCEPRPNDSPSYSSHSTDVGSSISLSSLSPSITPTLFHSKLKTHLFLNSSRHRYSPTHRTASMDSLLLSGFCFNFSLSSLVWMCGCICKTKLFISLLLTC